jgi:hypothetical protein
LKAHGLSWPIFVLLHIAAYSGFFEIGGSSAGVARQPKPAWKFPVKLLRCDFFNAFAGGVR